MSIKYSDWIGELTPTVGTGDITLGGAIFGFATFESLGDTEVYYAIVDGINKETGVGTISGRVLQRTTITSVMIGDQFVPNAAPINLSGNAQVYGIINSRYFQDVAEQFADLLLAIETIDQNTQPIDPTLTAFAGLVGAADRLPYFTGADTFALATLTSFARTLLDDSDAATSRDTLDINTATLSGITSTIPDGTDILLYFVNNPKAVFRNSGAALVNGPPNFSGGTHEFNLHGASGSPLKALHGVLKSVTISNGVTHVNALLNGVWGGWKTQYSNNNILGNVSLSGGVPSGAIIERGSNANGEYVQFTDGTQICTKNGMPGTLINAGNIYSPVTFPAAFTNLDGIATQVGFTDLVDQYPKTFSGPTAYSIISDSGSSGSTNIAIFSNNTFTSANATVTRLGYIATGRW